jgi:flavin-dependent dehydrogenase
MFDIIIIGAGPAGATFARLASNSRKILLIDRWTSHEKCCGGLIAPDAQKMLAAFDYGIPKEILSDPQLFYVRSVDLESRNEGKYQRHYTNIDRKLLDGFIISKLPANVTFKPGCYYSHHNQDEKNISVFVKENGELKEYTCKLLVGADGANSAVRKNIYNDFGKIRKYLAIQGQYELDSKINHYCVFFDRKITDFYSWLIPKDETLYIGGAFDQKNNPRQRYDQLIEAVRSKGYVFGNIKKLDSCFLLRPRLRDVKTGKGSVVLIGEAGGFISPSSSEGFSYAYRSAAALARVINERGSFDIKRYKRSVMSLKFNILIKNAKSIFMYNYHLRNLIFKLKIGSV